MGENRTRRTGWGGKDDINSDTATKTAQEEYEKPN